MAFSHSNSVTPVLALDCEMVETEDGDALGRVSIINYYGHVLYDQYVRPLKQVVDYRSAVSGITAEKLKTAVGYNESRDAVTNLLREKVVVGHSLKFDLKVLNYEHPKHLQRDVSKWKRYQDTYGKKISLKALAATFLQVSIQDGIHSSVDDARAALGLYLLVESEWEKQLALKRGQVFSQSTLKSAFTGSDTKRNRKAKRKQKQKQMQKCSAQTYTTAGIGKDNKTHMKYQDSIQGKSKGSQQQLEPEQEQKQEQKREQEREQKREQRQQQITVKDQTKKTEKEKQKQKEKEKEKEKETNLQARKRKTIGELFGTFAS